MIKVIGNFPAIQSAIKFDPIGSYRLQIDVPAGYGNEIRKIEETLEKNNGQINFVITFQDLEEDKGTGEYFYKEQEE